MGKFATNHWYAAAWASQVGDTPFACRILDEPIVLFRQGEGMVAALTDRCPHRLVPLSMGVCVNGNLRCGYHGMEFNAEGRCVHIPAQDIIPPKARTRSFPVIERYNLIWLWMGDAASADPAQMPTIEHYGEDGWDLIDGGYQHHPSNYLNIVENLMDPAHTTFVHKQTIGDPLAKDAPVQMEKAEDHVVAYKWLKNTDPSPNDRRIRDFGDRKVDRGQYFYFYPPSMSRVEIVVVESGQDYTDENLNRGLRTYSYKFLTPETEGSTHFFWLHVRNYLIGNQEWADKLRGILEFTYLEDRDIEMAMQRSQDELGVRQITGLEIDRAPMIAVRMIQRMATLESGPAQAEAQTADA